MQGCSIRLFQKHIPTASVDLWCGLQVTQPSLHVAACSLHFAAAYRHRSCCWPR